MVSKRGLNSAELGDHEDIEESDVEGEGVVFLHERLVKATVQIKATTSSSAGDAATEKEALKRRLGELQRLLKSRKGSLNATCRKY